MKQSSLYGHVLEILGLTAGSRRPVDEVVGDFFRTRHYLGARDRRFIGDAVFDIVRNQTLLSHITDQAMSRFTGFTPEPRAWPFFRLAVYLAVVRKEELPAILAALSSLWETYGREPSLDIFLDSVVATWSTFVWPESPVERFSLAYSIHPLVVRDWVDHYGVVGAEQLCVASNSPPPTTGRVNALKCTREECQARLQREGITVAPTLLSPVGLRFERRSNIQGLSSFRDGWFEMQDEGSQIISYLLRAKEGDAILDACAGGGGKTLHLAALMKNAGKLIASDSSRARLKQLKERGRRAGVTIVEISPPDPTIGEGVEKDFDAVLIDAPCTGTGTYRRNPWLKAAFQPEEFEHVLLTQRGLLERHSRAVRPGGKLVYATCSLLRRENEEQIELFLRAHADFSLIRAGEILAEAGIDTGHDQEYLTLLPHLNGTDGYFAAVLRKKGSER
ncbi:MAG: RsmB/NOP family class I SAM-dependent RNA methyltransferase [Bacteroidota bacterium]